MRAALTPELPPPMHDHLARQHPRHAAEQHARAALVFGQEISADDDRHAPGDLAHRFEQRQAAVHLDGFVGDAGRAALREGFGQRPVRGEVQIGEKKLARAAAAGIPPAAAP